MANAGAVQVAEAWSRLASARNQTGSGASKSMMVDITEDLRTLDQYELGEHSVAWFLGTCRDALVESIAPRFWRHFEGLEGFRGGQEGGGAAPGGGGGRSEGNKLAEALEEATRALHLQLETAVAMEQVFGEEYMVVRRCKQQFTACLFGSDVPRGFDAVLRAVYSSSFRDFCKFVAGGGKLSAGLGDDGLGCSDLDMELGDGENDDVVEEEDDDGEMEEEGGGWDELGFKSICANVVMVGAQPLAEEVFTEILYSRISDRIQAMSSGQFDTPQLGRVVGWSERCILPWLRLLLREAETEPGAGDAEYTQWKTRLQFFMFETFGSLRIKEMFDIIVEYPDSMPALKDLKASLTKTHQYSQLASSVSDACCKRLLHAGANTGDIISTYISTIKALHELDPTGMTIAAVSRSIQQYLRDRQDTVRCIVMGLTDDTSSELFDELRKSGAEEGRWRPKQADWDEGADDEEDEDCLARVANPGSAASQWMPEPIAAGPSTAYHKGSIDIIGMLVDIYGSTDLFLNEYRVLLSDKLLALTTYEIDKELHNVELLKLRFGEASLHGCEVMLKDLGDSKRLDAYVHNESAKHSEEAQVQGWLDSKILSAAFWPPLPQDAMTMHDAVANHFNAYAKFYSLLKKPRSLKWKPTCGVVKLTITFDDGRQVPFTVSPVHANIILHFQEQPTWTLDQLSSKIGIASDQVKRRMIFWVGSGVCTETVSSGGSISYTVVEKPSANALKAHSSELAADEFDGASQADDGQEAVILSYVVGMLTNFKTLPLERVHNMLKMFVTEPPYNKKIQELQAILDKLVSEEKLEVDGGNYTLKQA